MSGKPIVEEMLQKIGSINRVEGFDPTPFAVEYTDMNTGESRKRLPVMIQMAWFRLKYPEGRIAVEVNPARDCFVATARVYPSYKDGPECFLAEATASRGPDPSHPSVSPRSGPRPSLWASPCETRDLACNFTPLGTPSWRMPLTNWGRGPGGTGARTHL